MPPKKSFKLEDLRDGKKSNIRAVKINKSEAIEKQAKKISSDGVKTKDDDLPELEMHVETVSNALKEKYEYKPAMETQTIYVRPEARRMSEIMSKFEYCRIIGIRAKQLEDDNTPFTDVGNLSNPIDIAIKEIHDKKCPLAIERKRVSDDNVTIVELWRVNEMGIPFD